jgi:hypothetical protein
MDAAEIHLTDASFSPGGEIRGKVSWSRPAAPRRVELRLFWRTQGRGDRDSATVWEHSFERPAAGDQREFETSAPAAPGSFSGTLISLIWAFELVIDGKSAALAEVVIAPGGVEMSLQHPEWLALETPWDAPKISWFEKLRPKVSR